MDKQSKEGALPLQKDTSPNDKKTILPLKNFTPAHCFRIQPAHCLIKHKLKIFSLSLSPVQLPLLQSIVTAARYLSTQGQASLFAITVASKTPAKLQARPIPTPTKKTHLALQQKNFLPLSRVWSCPNSQLSWSEGLRLSGTFFPSFTSYIFVCVFVMYKIFFFFLKNRYV